ncbi:glycosyltransferase [bacterium]|nr:glycosyltransferase [bacterium]
MKILFYRYGSICEPDIIKGFEDLGHTVTQITEEITNKNIMFGDCARIVGQFLMDHPHDFVFTVNYFPIISDVCNIFKIPYLCWSVDSPVMELFAKSIQHSCNRIFLFDRAQFDEIAPFNPANVFHLPLAVNVADKQTIIQNALPADIGRFSSSVSFVGSLYTEKCPYDRLSSPPDYLSGYLNGLMEAQLQVYGYYFIEDLLPDPIVENFKAHMENFYTYPLDTFLTDRTTLAQLYIGNKITAMERLRTMGFLSKYFDVDLYTGSDTSSLPLIHNKGLAKSLTEMPIIFHESKINLNTTSKAIRSGLPLRIFDILGCGGFVLTNYQTELTDLFVLNEDIVAYSSLEEAKDLITYYLEHESLREEIAFNGYEKVKKYHTYTIRLEQMLKLAFKNY